MNEELNNLGLRDLIALVALHGLLAGQRTMMADRTAAVSYEIADAMIAKKK